MPGAPANAPDSSWSAAPWQLDGRTDVPPSAITAGCRSALVRDCPGRGAQLFGGGRRGERGIATRLLLGVADRARCRHEASRRMWRERRSQLVRATTLRADAG